MAFIFLSGRKYQKDGISLHVKITQCSNFSIKKLGFIGTQAYPFIYVLSVATFMLHQCWAVRAETVGTTSKIFTLWSFKRKCLLSPVYTTEFYIAIKTERENYILILKAALHFPQWTKSWDALDIVQAYFIKGAYTGR